jgi:NADH:ubiquinone oxidoreductase subunit K
MQNVMGISYLIYYISWLIFFLLNAFSICTLMLLILYFEIVVISSGFEQINGSSFAIIAILFYSYASSIVGFSLLLSVFFKKAKFAREVSCGLLRLHQ